jgi:LuxR family maltose regulon positive regulatory protein
LPLASLRAADDITEVRAAELRFSDDEASALLNGSLGLELDLPEVEVLQVRTEGWVAGLRLAALSVQAQEDPRQFIAGFAGDDRQVGDYLHEVLADQPTGLRTFLLRTSVLDRMSAPLCDVLTGAGDAAARLDEIEHANLFLVPLDSHREWYRYHHLFRDLLRHELVRAHPDLVPALHRRAAAWYREDGATDDAIIHFAAAGDYDDAADVIAGHWRRTVFHLGQVETAARWLDRLPPAFVLRDARLCLARGWIGVLQGRHEEVRESLEAAEACPPPPGQLYAIASSIESAVAQLRATYALLCGDVAGAAKASRQALELEADPSSLAHAVAGIYLGASLYFAGEPTEAERVLETGLARLEEEEWRTAAVIAGLGYSASIHADAARLTEAVRASAKANRLIESWHHGEGAWAAPALVASGTLLERRGEVAGAQAAFERAVTLARRGGRRLDLVHALILLARLARRGRDQDEARAHIRDARRVLSLCPDPGVLSDHLAGIERSLSPTRSRADGTVLPADLDLSERELTVLRLLASELSQREIGSELYISLNTVKGHVRSIFRKLGVATRADAVARARELGLI